MAPLLNGGGGKETKEPERGFEEESKGVLVWRHKSKIQRKPQYRALDSLLVAGQSGFFKNILLNLPFRVLSNVSDQYSSGEA